VKKAVASDGPPTYRRQSRGSVVDPVEPRIRELLQACPTMPATVIADPALIPHQAILDRLVRSRAGRLCNDYWLVTAGFGRKLDHHGSCRKSPNFALSRRQRGICPCMLPIVTATITMHLLHRFNASCEHFSGRRSVRNEKVSLTALPRPDLAELT
jgi:hypothetical protein